MPNFKGIKEVYYAMKKKRKVLTSFGEYTDGDLDTKARHILEEMTGNADFPSPEPPLKDLENAINAFEEKRTKAVDGSKKDTEAKKIARESLENVLTRMALYVELASNGDNTKKEGSGFTIEAEESHPVGLLSKPKFGVRPGPNKGSIFVGCEPIEGASSYRFEYMKLPVETNSAWTVVTGTNSKQLITGLESVKEYNFRCAGIGTERTLVYSDIITSAVL